MRYCPAIVIIHDFFIEPVPPFVECFIERLRCACQGKHIPNPLVTRWDQMFLFYGGDIVATPFPHAPNAVLSLRPTVGGATPCDRILTRNRLDNLVPGFFEGLESLREL